MNQARQVAEITLILVAAVLMYVGRPWHGLNAHTATRADKLMSMWIRFWIMVNDKSLPD